MASAPGVSFFVRAPWRRAPPAASSAVQPPVEAHTHAHGAAHSRRCERCTRREHACYARRCGVARSPRRAARRASARGASAHLTPYSEASLSSLSESMLFSSE
eukprot:1609652-Prymnesium_polylepis.1